MQRFKASRLAHIVPHFAISLMEPVYSFIARRATRSKPYRPVRYQYAAKPWLYVADGGFSTTCARLPFIDMRNFTVRIIMTTGGYRVAAYIPLFLTFISASVGACFFIIQCPALVNLFLHDLSPSYLHVDLDLSDPASAYRGLQEGRFPDFQWKTLPPFFWNEFRLGSNISNALTLL